VFTKIRRGLPGGPRLLVHDRSIQKPEGPRQVLGLGELIVAGQQQQWRIVAID
jgi:hypothetical protein